MKVNLHGFQANYSQRYIMNAKIKINEKIESHKLYYLYNKNNSTQERRLTMRHLNMYVKSQMNKKYSFKGIKLSLKS